MKTDHINLITGLQISGAPQAQTEGATHVLTVFDNGTQVNIYGKAYAIKKHYAAVKNKYRCFTPVTLHRYLKNQYS